MKINDNDLNGSSSSSSSSNVIISCRHHTFPHVCANAWKFSFRCLFHMADAVIGCKKMIYIKNIISFSQSDINTSDGKWRWFGGEKKYQCAHDVCLFFLCFHRRCLSNHIILWADCIWTSAELKSSFVPIWFFFLSLLPEVSFMFLLQVSNFEQVCFCRYLSIMKRFFISISIYLYWSNR